MRLLQVRNGLGLAFTISCDRCADISRLSFQGINYGYFGPCGYVSPKYYDGVGDGFLKSFTAGFFTTCGLASAGAACVDRGEALPLHGTISNMPAETVNYWVADGKIHIEAVVRDAALFSRQILLTREYICPLEENAIYLTDRIRNIGPRKSPLELIYHCNMGYPLLSEDAVLTIPSSKVIPRDDHARTGIRRWMEVESPQLGYEEMCYFHEMQGPVTVSLFNPKLNRGMELSYHTDELACFTQWKMMGEGEYVMGLEPGNCIPEGRDMNRKQGNLDILEPGAERAFHIKFTLV